ncbi:IgaA/UmoB family intracellular growth attenuator [Sodalis sp.]|uniref:IgaA/UmoB family intracellular growth attenuator n=1 Tax=Sodalis sp. (in: enterobacteria) TaxID=1898979 RepID=UPI0038733AEA
MALSTNITVEAHDTRHISLHIEPERVSLWRNVGTTLSLLLMLLLTVAAFNTILLIRHLHNERRRARNIRRYYDGYFNHERCPRAVTALASERRTQ